MLTETVETLGCFALAAFNDFGYNSFSIVKPNFLGNAAYVHEHCNQSFGKALHVFAIIQLEIAAITDTSEDAVKKQLSRGRDKLKEKLKL